MKLPLDLERYLMLWAGLENSEIESTMGFAKTSAMFREYQPNTSWRELRTRHEWSAEELRGVESVTFEMQKLALIDKRYRDYLRHYWKNRRSINSLIERFGGSKYKTKEIVNTAHKYLMFGLGYGRKAG